MFVFKKVLVLGAAMALLAPYAAFAETTSTTSVNTTLTQLQQLQSQINGLQQQQLALIQTLKIGASGDDIKTLQALLSADATIYPEGIISGYFGKLTAEAVKRFQKKNGLEQVGNVGPKTLKKLQEFLEENPLAFGMASSTATSTPRGKGDDKRPCAIVPPGHLIAPGWLKKHDGEMPVVPPCQTLPPGIEKKMGDDWKHGTSTPPVTGTTTPPVVDTTAPVISGVNVSAISSTTAVVSWMTNENASGKVYFSATTPVNLTTAIKLENAALTTGHAFFVTGLTASTTYHYVVGSNDQANNVATSSESMFTTTN